MHPSKPNLTDELQRHVAAQEVWKAAPFPVNTYRQLVEHVARLSYCNPMQLLFFRGQDKDFQSRKGGSTIYPAIYRGDNLPQREVAYRFQQLDAACSVLLQRLRDQEIEGHQSVARKKYIQWSILQHYEVLPTPLLDVTHSLRVACSFAQQASTDRTCFVYAVGLPFSPNRIAINSEEEIVNVRLLSICPPTALRPFFQEGYMVGTPDVTSDYDSKTDLDFRNRLVAKFAIPRAASRFWGEVFSPLPHSALYPLGDRMKELCSGIAEEVQRDLEASGTIADFLVYWSDIEQRLLDRARTTTGRNLSVPRAIRALQVSGVLPEDDARELQYLRTVRNSLVHSREGAASKELGPLILRLRRLLERLKDSLK